jgi:transcriptional regulator with XRE-family HTH domain
LKLINEATAGGNAGSAFLSVMDKAGEKLEKYRLLHELSQEDVAFMLDVPVADYLAIENGWSELSLKLMLKLCRFYKIRPDELLEGELRTGKKDVKDVAPKKTVRITTLVKQPVKVIEQNNKTAKDSPLFDFDKPRQKITPKQAMAILKEHGTEVTEEEAEKVLEFMNKMAKLTLDQVMEEAEWEQKLLEFPGGYEFDKAGYGCRICGDSTKNGWYDKYGLKCRLCQNAVDQKIIPGRITANKESYYTEYELEKYFGLKGTVLTKWIKEGIIRERTIKGEDGKWRHYRIFLLSDNKGFLPPKKKLDIGETITYMKDGEEYQEHLEWYECVDPFKYLKNYGIMQYMKLKEPVEKSGE